MIIKPSVLAALLATPSAWATPTINRQNVVQQFNIIRHASSNSTPLQVGNGNFAFGVDVTGLQTFAHFSTLSTWGWHNFSLPTTPNQTDPSDFTGIDFWTHGRLVNYDQPNPAENDISNWLIQNPQRINLANIGLHFGNDVVTEADLDDIRQELDLWTGTITSTYTFRGSRIRLLTRADSDSDSVGISVESDLVSNGSLGVFLDFPYSDTNKFDAPYVGVWNATSNHTTSLQTASDGATIKHVLDDTVYYTAVKSETAVSVTGPAPNSHKYFMTAPGQKQLNFVANFAPQAPCEMPTYPDVRGNSDIWWQSYWNSGAFVDLSAANNANATELSKRIIVSRYLQAVNSASDLPPQESGLVNNGWYGKFHLEMPFWHLTHFARWGHWDLLWRSMPHMYADFLESSYERARLQGYKGARWGKMTDPTGRSAPGEINSLLIWQQPHPTYFAELEYRTYPNSTTLDRWDEIITATADFMASFAFYNQSTKVYDLGPPMLPVSENTAENSTMNPTFELSYWRFGLDIASKWKQRQNLPVPAEWTTVRDNLAPLPVVDDTFPIYEGIPNMWTDNATTSDHPAMIGIYGWLPPPMSGPPLNLTLVQNTANKIIETWDLPYSYGWDFSMLAMNSLRLGNVQQAIDYLLHPVFQFDDAGYPVGGSRVPTPYMPNAASLLLAVAMMAGGWDGSEGSHFPAEWNARVEGFVPGI